MGHAEFSRHRLDVHVATGQGSPAGSLHGTLGDPALAAAAAAELADPCIVNWESAWIDLGGEG